MAEIKKYLDQAGLQQLVTQIKAEDVKVKEASNAYADGLAKNYDAAGAAATAETNAKAYADGLAKNYDAAGSAAAVDAKLTEEVTRATGKEAELQGAIEAVETTAGDNKTAIEAINNETTGILAQAKADATSKANAVQENVDELAEYVGTIPEGATATDIVGYVQERTSGIATESALSEIQEGLTQAQKDIDAIEADYLKGADKTELEGKIGTAQSAAEAAQSHSEGVASDLAEAVEALEGADAAQVERIAALEGTITGLSGAMHFEGVKDEVPTDVTGYEQGDVIIVGNKEYVLNGDAFVEFGDASVNAEAITALTGRVGTLESDMTQAKTDIDNVEAAVATKAEQSALEKEIEDREAGDSALDTRLQAVEAQLGDGENSVSDLIATAKQEAITAATEAAATDATTKANTAESNAKSHADSLNTAMNTRVEALEAIDHSHANQAELDLIASGDKAKWDAAAAKAHEHTNKTELDKIADGDVAKWNAAEQNAKDHANSLNTAMDTRMSAVEKKASDNEAAIAEKADADDLSALTERVTTAESNIAANTSAINSFVAITTAEVDALFA